MVTQSLRLDPEPGIAASFRLDGLSLTFGLLITGIGAIVFLYASAYLRGAPRLMRFYTVLTLFMASMLGAVLADDLILLVVFWELTSLTSFLLIGIFAGEGAEPSLGPAGPACHRRRGSGRCWRERSCSDPSPEPTRSRHTGARRDHCGRPCRACNHPADRGGAFAKSAQGAAPLVAGERDGRADPRLGLPSLRDDGEARHLSPGPPRSGVFRSRTVDRAPHRVRRGDHAGRRHAALRETDLKRVLAIRRSCRWERW